MGRWFFVQVKEWYGEEVEAYCTLDDDGDPIHCAEVYTSWNSEGFDWSDENLKCLDNPFMEANDEEYDDDK
eukprot:gene1754-12352_t